LSKLDKMTREDAFALAFDTKVYDAEKWQDLLQKVYSKNRSRFKHLQPLVEQILQWNGRLDRDQTGPVLYYRWRAELGDWNEVLQEYADGGRMPDDHEARAALQALDRAARALRDAFGTAEVRWGDFLRLVRGKQSWPLDGGSFSYGMSTLRAVWGRKVEEANWLEAAGGQSCPMLVFLSKPIQSYSVLPWGVSDDPESSHFADQAPLFASLRMKPTWFVPDSARAHAESETVFLYPPGD